MCLLMTLRVIVLAANARHLAQETDSQQPAQGLAGNCTDRQGALWLADTKNAVIKSQLLGHIGRRSICRIVYNFLGTSVAESLGEV